MDYKGRISRLRPSLDRQKLDVLLITHLPNVRYLCGFTGSAGTLCVTHGSAIFFTDGRYTEQAREEVKGARVVITRKSPLAAVAEWIRSAIRAGKRKRTIGTESEHMTLATLSRLSELLPKGYSLRKTSNLVEQLRMIKDENELALIRRAVHVGASLFDDILKSVRPGISETSVAAEMEYSARRKGAEGMSFGTIIASGKRSALPHARASEQPIDSPGFVVCDFGVILTGYCSDMTRTLYVGQPDREARSFYEAVLEAQLAGVDAVRPGCTVAEVDQATRKVLQKAKLARYFTHSTGHGVGLEIHEAPKIASGQTEVLRPGMVITIEPGAYIAGKWGVRIEDMVAVTEHACEVLTPTSKSLVVI